MKHNRIPSLEETLALAKKKEQWRQARARKKEYKGPRWRVRWTVLCVMKKGKRKQEKTIREATFRIDDYAVAQIFMAKKVMKYGLHRVAMDKIDPTGRPYAPERQLSFPQRTRGLNIEQRPKLVLAATIQEEDFGAFASLC